MQSKYHHLIPQTYMSAWANKSGTLKVKWLHNKKIEFRNTDSVAGVNHYHSIIAGMPFCTKTDTNYFFNELFQYRVFYNGDELIDSIEMNKYYGNFDNWKITRQDGSLVSKKQLKANIDNLKIQDIEELWSQKYESKWNKVRNIIEQKISQNDFSVPRFYFGYIIKFFVALDWRSILSNQEFLEFSQKFIADTLKLDELKLAEIEKTKNKYGHSMFETAYDYMKHCLLLDYYRKYLHDDGVIYMCAKQYMKTTSFTFLIATENETFITSDNPAFVYLRKDGLKNGIMPITPHILLVIGKKTQDEENYYIDRIGASKVKKYNKIIEKNASQFIVYENS